MKFTSHQAGELCVLHSSQMRVPESEDDMSIVPLCNETAYLHRKFISTVSFLAA